MRLPHAFLLVQCLPLFTSCCVLAAGEAASTKDREAFVFETKNLTRYAFPTHINDLVIDRAASNNSEVFVVVIEPGKAPPVHVHHDTEQVFYILEGMGVLSIGNPAKTFSVQPGQVVRVPPHTPHSIFCSGKSNLRYLCIDCFTPERDPKAEPEWDDHVKTVCKERGWSFERVKQVPSKSP